MDLKTIIETENHVTKTTLLGNDFEISADRNIYNAIRSKYKVLALTARSKFEEMDNQFTDIHDLTENAPNAFVVAIEDSLKELLQDIISMGIYTIDKDSVIERAFNGDYFDEFSGEFEKIKSQYEGIFQEVHDAEFYRDMRKECRPRWQSSTFGGNAINAWSNQFDVGMMNLAEGAGYAVLNWVENKISRANAKRKLAELFNKKILRQNMIDSVYYSCFNLHSLLIDIVKTNTSIDFKGTISDSDKQKAAAMFNNFTTISLSEEKQAIFINEIFTLNPYEEEYYKYFFIKFGDNNNTFGNFAQFFSINSFNIKNDILERYAKDNLGETEDAANNCKIKVDEYAERIGFETKYITTAYSIINEQLEKIDLEYRTIDGVVLETREIADEARNELVKIKEIMKDVQPPTNASTISYENMLKEKKQLLEEFKTDVKLKYISLVDEHLEKFDKLFTNWFGITLTREEKGQQLALSYVQSLPVNSYEELDGAKTKLIEYLPETGITLEQAVQANEYLNQCENRLNTIDDVVFSSREEAALGRKEFFAITDIMNTVEQPTKDSLLSYERNLLEIREKIQQQFMTPVKEKYIGIINKNLEKFDDLFKYTGAFTKVGTREEAAQDKALKFVKNLVDTNSTYDNIDNAKAELEKFLPEIGIELSQAVAANQYIQTHENRLNTVDGVVFDSREGAAKGKQELEEITGIMSTVVPPENNALLDYERNILDVKSRVEQFQTDVKLKYIGILQQHLKSFDEKFRKISLLKVAATREEAARDKALKFVKTRTYNAVSDVENAHNDLAALLPNLGIEMEQAVEAADYLASVKNRLESGKTGGFMSLFKK